MTETEGRREKGGGGGVEGGGGHRGRAMSRTAREGVMLERSSCDLRQGTSSGPCHEA